MKDNIIFIVLDSVRADRISSLGYSRKTTPHLDEFAEQAYSFESAYSTSSWSVPVHASLFTGLYPSEHGAIRDSESVKTRRDTLAARLSEEGYTTKGVSANPWLTDELGLTRGFDDFATVTKSTPFKEEQDPRDEDWEHTDGLDWFFERVRWCLSGNPVKRLLNSIYWKRLDNPIVTGEDINSRVKGWLAEESSTEPYMLFLNYMDAHEPYLPDGDELLEGSRSDSEEVYAQDSDAIGMISPSTEQHIARDAYDSSLRRLDERVNELFQLLSEYDQYDDSMIVLLSDHGQCFGEHGYWGHGTYLYDELVHVPVIVKPPAESPHELPRTVDRPVSLVDIPRFIFDTIGESFDERTDHSMKLDGKQRPVLMETHGPRSDMADEAPDSGYRRVKYRDVSLLRNLDTDEWTVPESNQSEIDSSRTDELINIESGMVDSFIEYDNEGDASISAGTKKSLQDLGYL